MRLGQLARKLNIKPTQIVSFLTKEHSITIDESLNSKIEDTILELVMGKFKVDAPQKVIKRAKKSIETPEVKIESKPIEVETKVEVEVEIVTDPIETPKVELEIEEEVIDIENVITTVTEEVANEIFEEEAIDEAIEVALDNIVIDELNITKEEIEELSETEPIELKEEIVETESLTAYDEDGEPIELTVIDGVIKAPKKELEGFKVIGKIDLPQKEKAITFIITKNGESTDITETIEQTRIELTEHKREKYLARVEKRKLASKSKPSKSRRTLSEMDIKEKANKLAVAKQIQHSKAKKEQQKKHYEQNKKAIQKTSKKKKSTPKKGNLKDMKSYDKKPTTKWGRIWKWFNT